MVLNGVKTNQTDDTRYSHTPVRGDETGMVPNRLASLVRLCFVKASPTVEKAILCYKLDRLIASLLSFSSIQSLLAICKFCAAGEERCE